jgi:hypothetical protein
MVSQKSREITSPWTVNNPRHQSGVFYTLFCRPVYVSGSNFYDVGTGLLLTTIISTPEVTPTLLEIWPACINRMTQTVNKSPAIKSPPLSWN